MAHTTSKIVVALIGSASVLAFALTAWAGHDTTISLDSGQATKSVMLGGYNIVFNQFELVSGTYTIAAVEVNFGNNLRGYPTDVLIYTDDDLDPADATLIYQATATPTLVPTRPYVYLIDPPVIVSGGYLLAGVAIKDRATWCDETVSGTRSWMAFEGITGPFFDPGDLSAADTLVKLDESNSSGHNCTWHIRAYSFPDPDVDFDGDGFNDATELFLGTDIHDACPDDPTDDSWPLDTNNDTTVGITDVLALRPFIFSSEGDINYNPRFDFNVSGDIGISDVLLFKPAMFTSCA